MLSQYGETIYLSDYFHIYIYHILQKSMGVGAGSAGVCGVLDGIAVLCTFLYKIHVDFVRRGVGGGGATWYSVRTGWNSTYSYYA